MLKKIVLFWAVLMGIGLLGGIENDNPIGLDLLLRVGGICLCLLALIFFGVIPICQDSKKEKERWLEHLRRSQNH